MKRVVITLVCAFLLVLLVGAGCAWYVFSELEGRGHIQDEVLIKNLQTDSEKYARLISMFRADSPLSVAHPNWFDPKHAITNRRWEEYKKLFVELGLDGGIRAWGGESIKFISTAQGYVGGGSSKGYMYKPENPTPLYSNLDTIPKDLPSNVTGYRKINDDWYIFLDWDD